MAPANMITTTPRMGTINWMIADIFKRLDINYVPPKTTTHKTVELGVRHSPEFACLPLKVTLGNFIESLESGEVDTLVMAGGCGPCRFGYYAQVQEQILGELGYSVRMLVVEPPLRRPLHFYRTVRAAAPGHSVRTIWRAIKTSFRKAQSLDRLECELLKVRCREVQRGSAEKAYKTAIKNAKEAMEWEEVVETESAGLDLIRGVDQDLDRPVLRMGIIGEYYMVLEPVVNFEVEKWLGERGVYLERSVFTSDWIGPKKKNPVNGLSHNEMAELARPYLSHFVGGEGQPTVGHAVDYARRGFDAAVHLMPFTCMPETIAKSLLPTISADYDFPVLSFVVDEQTGKAGVMTRLEALIDLCWSKKSKQTAGSRLIEPRTPSVLRPTAHRLVKAK